MYKSTAPQRTLKWGKTIYKIILDSSEVWSLTVLENKNDTSWRIQ
jgi:hypothetical protein